MIVKIYPNNSEGNQIYLEAETLSDNVEIIKMARMTRKPNRMFGNYQSNGLVWAWINMPCRKMFEADATHFDSEDK